MGIAQELMEGFGVPNEKALAHARAMSTQYQMDGISGAITQAIRDQNVDSIKDNDFGIHDRVPTRDSEGFDFG